MAKTDITTQTISNNLKTGMLAIGRYSGVSDLNVFYSGGNVLWLLNGTTDGGLYRCTSSGGSFDLFPPDDSDITRAWSFEELTRWFVKNYVYSNYAENKQGANFIISFTVAGLNFSGTNSVKVAAFSNAIIELLNSAVAFSGLK